jgi:hypothetical protein
MTYGVANIDPAAAYRFAEGKLKIGAKLSVSLKRTTDQKALGGDVSKGATLRLKRICRLRSAHRNHFERIDVDQAFVGQLQTGNDR